MTAKNSFMVVDRKTFKELSALQHSRDALLTVKTAAVIASMSESTLLRRIHDGEIPARLPQAGKRGIRIRRADLDGWLAPNNTNKTPTGDNREGQYNIGGSK